MPYSIYLMGTIACKPSWLHCHNSALEFRSSFRPDFGWSTFVGLYPGFGKYIGHIEGFKKVWELRRFEKI